MLYLSTFFRTNDIPLQIYLKVNNYVFIQKYAKSWVDFSDIKPL